MKISVIVPVYNKEGYLNDLLSDLSAQTFSDYECILIDDGSTDGSGEICDRISNSDDRFKVFHIKNGGVSNARNFGIDKAQGELFFVMDSDDYLTDDALEKIHLLKAENGE